VTRAEILEAAAQSFRQKGFHATSMQDIADAVNLQKASLYHHISSKQEILLDLLDQALEMLIERISEVAEQPLAPDERLRLAIRTYLEALAEHPDLSGVLLLEHRSLIPKLRKRHFPKRDRFEALWRGIIEEGIEDGCFVCQEPSLAVKALLGILNWTIMWYRPDGRLSADEIAAYNAGLFLHGLCARDKS